MLKQLVEDDTACIPVFRSRLGSSNDESREIWPSRMLGSGDGGADTQAETQHPPAKRPMPPICSKSQSTGTTDSSRNNLQ